MAFHQSGWFSLAGLGGTLRAGLGPGLCSSRCRAAGMQAFMLYLLGASTCGGVFVSLSSDNFSH